MATIAEFAVIADDFPLGDLLESFPDVTVEIERIVPTNRVILPYFWVRNVPVERVEETLETREALESFTVADEMDDRVLIRADWNPDVEGVLTGLVETDLTLLSAVGRRNEWQFEFRAEYDEQIAGFQRYCSTHDITAELTRLHALGEPNDAGHHGLTREQREALQLAYENRYYDIPRETDLESLADELDITRQSFADRLRRGHRNLIGTVLATT